MTAREAVSLIRSLRPGSIETEFQEEFCTEYEKHLWRQLNAFAEQEDGINVTGAILEGRNAAKKLSIPKYVLLMGLPGSGKSTIAECIEQKTRSAPKPWLWMNQDELSHRVCVQRVGQVSADVARGQLGGLVVDCTNVTSKHRAEWLKVMHQPAAKETALVHFDISPDVCAQRVAYRANHPSIPFGRGDRIVRGFASQLEPPTQDEKKMFGSVSIIQSPQEAVDLLRKWGL